MDTEMALRPDTVKQHENVPKRRASDGDDSITLNLRRNNADKDQTIAELTRKNRFLEEEKTVLNRRIDELTTIAYTDSLTGAFNRRSIDEMFTEKFIAQGGAIIIIDLNKFKPINDTFGHGAGDDALKLVARTLKNSMEGRGVVARIGGDEFAIILQKSSPEQALVITNELKKICSSFKIDVADELGSQKVEFSASIGMEPFKAGDDFEKTKANADQKMYDAKKTKGLNR